MLNKIIDGLLYFLTHNTFKIQQHKLTHNSQQFWYKFPQIQLETNKSKIFTYSFRLPYSESDSDLFFISYQHNNRKHFKPVYQPSMSTKKQMTLVYYYIPEDHDDEETPNVFGVMVSKNNIRLHHLYENFPLKGHYIFRFKVMYDNAIAWLDLPELDTKLPTFKDKIVVKATRISWNSDPHNLYGHYRIGKKEQTTPSRQIPTTQTQVPPTKSQPVSQSQPVQQPTRSQPTTDLLSQKHEPAIFSTNPIKIQASDLLNQKPTAPTTTIPQDFNFDLLGTPASSNPNTQSTSSNSKQNGGIDDMSGLLL